MRVGPRRAQLSWARFARSDVPSKTGHAASEPCNLYRRRSKKSAKKCAFRPIFGRYCNPRPGH